MNVLLINKMTDNKHRTEARRVRYSIVVLVGRCLLGGEMC